ncbi:nuclear receptor coactivator 7-like isoform X2 [Ctenocephalides felis]|uniref:nuclear receptor coactivator 7-like isoform X2 n=1 Tax=Ctenocephalides felis TaxID=7515 RepID=UPI000E6E3345|nr:nuclear receptor coactivator 7-like isoform X2 [Ctenocephalides felis]
MFDPNVSDPLVIEHGPESYGVIAPMDLVVNSAIYYDIAHMRVGHIGNESSEKPEIYHPSKTCTHSPGKDSLLVKDETFPELGGVETDLDGESICSYAEQREGDAFPKAFERDLVTPTNLSRSQGDSTESEGGSAPPNATAATMNVTSTLEERRRSLLDQHWAIPSKDRSLDDQDSNGSSQETPVQVPVPNNINVTIAQVAETSESAPAVEIRPEDSEQMTKQSCYDSGIDMREPVPPPVIIPPMNTKKVYTDADIVLSSDWVPPVTIAPPANATETLNNGSPLNKLAPHIDTSGRKKASSVSFSLEDATGADGKDQDKQETKKNKMLKRLSYPLAWVEGLTGSEEQTPPTSAADPQHTSMFSKVFSRRSSIGTFMRDSSSSNKPQRPQTAAPKLDYRSMVSIDDMPDLFVSFDINAPMHQQLDSLELIPRAARACPDPPLYLRLRMGRPLAAATQPPARRPSVMSYGKKKMRPEYWFSVPRNRVDDLYRFLHVWVPHLYGELNEAEIRERGYEPIDEDTDWGDEDAAKDGQSDNQDDISELTRESWELLKAPYIKIYNILKSQNSSGELGDSVLSMSDELRRALYATPNVSLDVDLPIPELVGHTEILTEEHREKLCGHLPARAEGYMWSLVFSTSQHGFSLNSMYRKMQRLESPVLIVIQDTDNNVFGALTSCSLKVSDHFYGTGESLLFKFNPDFRVFHWSGENLYFIKGNNESIAIGAGDGKFGLWLDGDLYQGRSQRCSTYANEPLAPQEDFVVKTLECWAFL